MGCAVMMPSLDVMIYAFTEGSKHGGDLNLLEICRLGEDICKIDKSQTTNTLSSEAIWLSFFMFWYTN